ncbi:unnamed protein product, partial [Mesorhabditis spiculigera]
MKEIRVQFLIAHSISMVYESVMFTIVPELYFPGLSGRILGPWDSVFGFGARHAFGAGAFLTVVINESVKQMFTFKHQALLDPDSRLKVSKKNWSIYVVVFYILNSGSVFIVVEMLTYESGPDSPGLQAFFAEYPCMSVLSNYTHVYAAMDSNFSNTNISIIKTFGFIVLYICVGNISINCGCINHSFHILEKESNHMSASTRRMQKRFLTTLCIQNIIPLTASGLPWLYFPFILITKVVDPHPGSRSFSNSDSRTNQCANVYVQASATAGNKEPLQKYPCLSELSNYPFVYAALDGGIPYTDIPLVTVFGVVVLAICIGHTALVS